MAQLVVGGGGEGGDADVTWIERRDEALDGATLAGGIPPLEDDADGRTQFPPAQLATDDQAQMQQPELGRVQALLLFVSRETSGEVHILQPGDVVWSRRLLKPICHQPAGDPGARPGGPARPRLGLRFSNLVHDVAHQVALTGDDEQFVV